MIHALELDNYYELLATSKQNSPSLRDNVKGDSYDLYDEADFQKEFCHPSGEQLMSCRLYVDNLSCYACVWLGERAVRSLAPENIDIKINLASGSALILYDPAKVKLSTMVRRLEQLGYPTSPMRQDANEQRRSLTQIGVAGFCFANLMLFAVTDYLDGGLEVEFRNFFNWISAGLATLCLLVAGRPFYQNAWLSLRRGMIHLDLPIFFAIFIAYIFSLYNTIRGQAGVYFDSLAAIIFLILVARYFQKMILTKHLRRSAFYNQGRHHYVRRLESDDTQTIIPLSQVKAGDRLRILAHHVLPARCRLSSDETELSSELVDGEPEWKTFRKGDELPAGFLLGELPADVEALEDGAKSFLARISAASERIQAARGQFTQLSETLGRWLVVVVLAIVAIQWFALRDLPMAEKMSRMVATLLITCPCTFGIGTPLVFARAFRLGYETGVVWNNQRAVETLAKIRHFFFDKTGTLTLPNAKAQLVYPSQADFALEADVAAGLREILSRVDEVSSHHVARGIAAWARGVKSQVEPVLKPDRAVIIKAVEVKGQGLSLETKLGLIKIGRAKFAIDNRTSSGMRLSSQVTAYVSLNGLGVAAFRFEEQAKPEAEALLKTLAKQGRKLTILSGDQSQAVERFTESMAAVGLSSFGKLSPVAKVAKLSHLNQSKEQTAMVGNGINDIAVLSKADLGIVVNQSSDWATEKADMILVNDLAALIPALSISRRARRALLSCFIYAISFNTLGIVLGTIGFISPVMAAILMPISSLIVFSLATVW